MEDNKDEAVKAKEIAEKKFMGRDYDGAKKFALKAQRLYPTLEGLSQMLSVFDVYISAQNRISNGEVDWYSVLGVNCFADDKTVKKQYHKLALMLHPDKNKSIGADGAFKLVQEAWVLLSDKEKRLAYNQKLNQMGREQSLSTETKVPSAQSSANGFHNHKRTGTSQTGSQDKNPQSRTTSVPSSPSRKPDTFWTMCNRCMMHYEYLRIYLNQNLTCPCCYHPFVAYEVIPGFKTYTSMSSANGFHNHKRTRNSHTRTDQNKNTQPRPPTPVPFSSSRKPDTFWTICNRCMLRHEYLRVYLNHTLTCPYCCQPFLAYEVIPEFMKYKW